MDARQFILESDLGPLHLVASEKGLRGVFWKKQEAPLVLHLDEPSPSVQFLKETVLQLEEYLAGKRQSFDLSFDIQGTDFQKAVWLELAKIPYGKTLSYSDIARKIKNAKAVRAVGTANGRNPLSLIVPCHRVIAANGTLGGYAGGLPIKKRLLSLERAQTA